MADKDFKTPQDALAHYGKKGMKWGVRNDDRPKGGAGSSSRAKPPEDDTDAMKKATDAFYAKKDPASLQKEGRAKLKEQQSSEFPSKKGGRLTARQKKLIAIGGIAAVGVTALYVAERRQMNALGITPADKSKAVDDAMPTHKREWEALFGPGSAPDMNYAMTSHSALGGGFYSGFTTKKVWDRPEFTIPEDTIFQRLSSHPEDSSDYGKVKGAYATFLSNDKKLYGAGGEFGFKEYTVNFTAKGPTKVPSHRTVLAHLKQIQQQETPGVSVTDASVAAKYHALAGGSWSDSTSQKLFGSLRQFGYGAIVDDMDAGYLGDLPIVFFGKANTASSTPRTEKERLLDSYGLLKVSGKYA